MGSVPGRKDSAILIHLDELMDTREGALVNSQSTEVVQRVFTDNYHQRLVDRWDYVDMDAFREAYANRGRSVLRASHITPVLAVVKDFVHKTTALNENTPWSYNPVVVLNIHPYNLQPSEVEIFKKRIFIAIGGEVDFKVVDIPPADLTPGFLASEVSIATLYNYADWINIHTSLGTFSRESAASVGLLAPRIAFPLEPNDDVTVKLLNLAASEITELAAPFVGLRLLSIDTFSAGWRIAP